MPDSAQLPHPTLLDAFKVCGDPVLAAMRNAVQRFLHSIYAGGAPRWLFLHGSVGTGKTMLAEIAFSVIKAGRGFQATMTTPGPRFCKWPEIMSAYQSRQDITAKITAATRTPFLVLDDIGAEHITPATLAQLALLLDSRLNCWTLITSNLTPDRWDQLESRIASRFFRGQNEAVECVTEDYSLRRR